MPVYGPKELITDVHDKALCIGCGGCVNLCPYFKNHRGKTAMLFPCTLAEGRCNAHCPMVEVNLDEMSSAVWHKPYEGSPLGIYQEILAARSGKHKTGGAYQAGGSVMSHLRVSSQSSWSPQIPKGKAHMIVALEPIETIRVLMNYGSPETRAICNTRPIQPVGVICGDQNYPSLAELRSWIAELTAAAWFVDATDTAVRLGRQQPGILS